jgi:hypothetical protein
LYSTVLQRRGPGLATPLLSRHWYARFYEVRLEHSHSKLGALRYGYWLSVRFLGQGLRHILPALSKQAT